jgi:phosphate transport system permease protein
LKKAFMSNDTMAEADRPPRRSVVDKLFESLTRSAATLILLALAGVAAFLVVESWPAITASKVRGDQALLGYLWPLVFGTILAAALALAISAPLAIGVALFISHYAPKRLSVSISYVVDLLAAVPSVVYGLWGIFYLAPKLTPIYQWLAENLSWIPFFAGPASATGRTILTASIVLAVMTLPVISALSREIFLQTPTLHEEAALALGATRWEMIRMAVLPYGRSGIVSAAMLGLGRALGETMAVALVLSASGLVTFNLISSNNPSTIAANIALQFPEATGLQVNALIATGLALFIITFAVNFAARGLLSRSRAMGEE